MLKQVLVICGSVFILGGCIYNEEPVPKIVQGSPQKISAPKTVKADLSRLDKAHRYFDTNIPRDWLPPAHLQTEWTAIVIHHSATEGGNASIFDKGHRELNDWDGVGYDFVIGNGTNSGDGQVEVTFRWRQQRTGAHCKTPDNWANRTGIGICLVGNFDRTAPTWQQMRSLVKLVRFLQNRYRIPKSRIYGHNTTPGARATSCPGRNFPMARLKSTLDF